MSYSDSKILENLGKNIIIEPFNRQQLGSNSYDVLLGEYYYRYNSANPPNYISTLNPEQILQYWNVELNSPYFGAYKAYLIKTEDEALEFGVKIGQRIIIL
jgi:deoxycytidine triphosphate deaminase